MLRFYADGKLPLSAEDFINTAESYARQEVLRVLNTIHQRSEEDILDLLDELRAQYQES